jgi:predicted outer membrane repeat protein
VLIVVAAFLLISCQLGQNVNAKEYNVGTSGQTDYANLEELRDDVTTWNNGDEIIFHNDDNSLTDAFDFGGKKITISGNAKISPSKNDVQFSYTSSDTFLTIADDSSITFDGFLNNNYYGVIYSVSALTLSGTSTFTANSANYGGAIYSKGDVTIFGTNTFTKNNAVNGSGGAIYSTDITISGNNIFTENTAIWGGAIQGFRDVTISGTGMFIENTATYYDSSGGAIGSTGNVTITASTGDIVFMGNKANGSLNAIYMDNSGNNSTLSLAATSRNNVKFYDPIESYSTNPNPNDLTITINKESNQIGTVLFDMSNNVAIKRLRFTETQQFTTEHLP